MSKESKVTCEVIRDLLPLYADEVLSDDSRALVEEHMESCNSCRDYREILLKSERTVRTAQKSADADEVNEKAKEALKRINHTIRTKRFRSVLVTIVLIAAILSGLYYAVCVRQSYLPYDKTGLYLEDEVFKTKENFSGVYTFLSPDKETMFLYMSATAFDETVSNNNKTYELSLTDEEHRIYYDEFTQTTSTVKEIYYVPEETAEEYRKSIRNGSFWDETALDPHADQSDHEYWKQMYKAYIEANKEKMQNLKDKSILIWKAE